MPGDRLMTHISQGEIHAFIDGALVGDREREAREIKEHLDGCLECRQLLAKEQETVNTVSGLLSSALEIPNEVLDSFPSADEIRARAKAKALRVPYEPKRKGLFGTLLTTVKRPRFRGMILSPKLQLAAVLMVFLGGSWMMRGALLDGGLESPVQPVQSPVQQLQPPEMEALQPDNPGSLESDNLGGGLQDRLNALRDQAPINYEQACDSGDFSACNSLGLMYQEGDGVTQDLTRASAFFRRACDDGRGLEEACRRE
jgi:hypothetical protein